MQLGNFKRDYKFKSDAGGRWNYTIAIIISIIAFLLIWFLL